jgi:hypothetical protein
MAGKSLRDICFEEAVAAHNKAHPNDQLPLESQKPWVIDNGQWRPANVGERIWNWIKGGNAYRVPDWTITVDGKPVVGDNKFSGDSFSPRKGRSGYNQLDDYNRINNQQHRDRPEYQDLYLDPEKCQCDKEPQPEEVYDPALAPHQQGVPGVAGVVIPDLPGVVPGVAPEVVEIPVFEPIPVFVP